MKITGIKRAEQGQTYKTFIILNKSKVNSKG